MGDRLIGLLNHFELTARVFQAGPLCHSASFDAQDGLGYLHVLRSGKLKVDSGRRCSYLLEVPTLFFYMNPTSHRLIPQGNSVDIVCASFDFGAGLKNPLAKALPDALVLKLSDTPTLAASLNLLFIEAQEKHCGQQAVLNRLMEIIVVQLFRDLMDEQRMQVGLLAGLAEPKLARAINAIHSEPSRDWTLEGLAGVAGMSRARFAARFRDTVGMTPGSYLTEWRIGIAQSLLRRGKSVQLIASEVGYANASALSRAFATQVGVSPTEWKKRHASEL